MKYLLTILIVSTLSCKKNNDSKPKYDPAPSVTNIAISSELVNGVAHPKFTITLNVPDTAAVINFLVYTKLTFSIPCTILKPKTGTYTIIDSYNSFPPAGDKKTYTSSFIMADNSSLYNSTFEVF